MRKSKIFLLLVALMLTLTSAPSAQAQTLPPPEENIFLPYVYMDPLSDPYLHVSQAVEFLWGSEETPYPIPIEVLFLPFSGAAPPPIRVIVPVYGKAQIPLRQYITAPTCVAQGAPGWGNCRTIQSTGGAIRIRLAPDAPDPEDISAVQAEVLSIGTVSGRIYAASETSRLGGHYQGVVVRRPAASSRLYVAVQETLGLSTSVYLSKNDGGFFGPSPFTLPAWGRRLVEVTGQFTPGQVAEIEVNVSTGRRVASSLLTADEVLGVATLQPLLNIDPAGVLQGGPIRHGSGWGSTLGVVNNSNGTAWVLPSVYYYSSTGTLVNKSGTSFSVPGHGSASYSLSSLVGSLPAGVSTVTVRLDEAGSTGHRLAATLWNTNSGSNLVMPWMLTGESNRATAKSAVGFDLGVGSSDTTAVIGGMNLSPDLPTQAVLVISYIDPVTGQGRYYQSAITTLDPGGFVFYDLRALRTAGHLPAGLTTGSARIWSSIPVLWGVDATYSLAGGWGIQCAQTCGGPQINEALGENDPDGPIPNYHVRCRVAGRPSPLIYFQDYRLTEWKPWTSGVGDSEYGYGRFEACPPPKLTFCGELRRKIKNDTTPYWAEGQRLLYIDLTLSLPFVPVSHTHFDACLEQGAIFLELDPCEFEIKDSDGT